MKKSMYGLLLSVMSLPALAYDRDEGYAWGTVLEVKPLVEIVRSTEPEEFCREVVHYEKPKSSKTATILGTIIGGAIGNEIGHGKRNKQIGAVAGAVLGGAIGNDIAKSNQRPGRSSVRTVCDTRYVEVERERVSGYRVVYRYNDRNYTTEMPYDPGDEIRVRVSVAPVIDND
ncbi:glycine zipper 2TM domain-containing protein [Pleionea sp. CnH1-48]|uniref:glycine zipper 2TM domain-containing protein n=1 Tax=Pleionea sp. CnH1-48 TaxID=2954494 RepID=UPI0020970EDA|nr:glycine zipper 2TM domain-containing protein [Pleionea sp. CnH1-48]MCO7223503.1 glycine zipper 2TM domain-containing protein [Pleionea sp. CnH1-48]